MDLDCNHCGSRFRLDGDSARELAQCPKCERLVPSGRLTPNLVELVASAFVVSLLVSGVAVFLALVFSS